MTDQERELMFKRVMQIAGIFTLVVAGLLLINFLQLRRVEALESETLETLVEYLKDDPKNEVLMKEVREFDLVVRKAYFTAQWQVNTGAWLMVIGAVLFAFSLKVYTDIRKKIEVPEEEHEEPLKARLVSQRWLLVTGAIVFSGALIAAIFSNNYLKEYGSLEGEGQIAQLEGGDSQGVEIVEIGASSQEAGESESRGETERGGSGAVENGAVEQGSLGTVESGEWRVESGERRSGVMESREGEQGSVGETESSGAKALEEEKVYGFEEFKKHHNSFRGPMGHGLSYHKRIPVSWDGATGSHIKWKVAISKPGYNSPVIWGDKLFLAGGDTEARVVSCYDRHSGELLWERKADEIEGSPATMPKVTEDTGLSAPTMVVDGYRVYAIFASGDIIAFDLNGKRIWARNLGVPRNHYGHSSSLMAWNGKVIVQYDTGKGGRMLALKAQTGETVWDVKRDNGISWASPILVDVDGKVQVVTNTDPNVAGHDVETGEEIWKVAVMMGEVGPSCAYGEGMVFANNEYASLVAIKPVAGAVVEWEDYEYLSEAASPVVADGLLFIATSYGVVVCYDAKTGEKIWEHDYGVTLYSSPMVADGKLFMMDNDGVMHIMKVGRTFELIGEPDLGEASYAVPAFADGRIYLRGAGSLWCIE